MDSNEASFLNKDILWALNDRGLDAFNFMVQKGLDFDLAFELLSHIFREEEIYEPLKETS